MRILHILFLLCVSVPYWKFKYGIITIMPTNLLARFPWFVKKNNNNLQNEGELLTKINNNGILFIYDFENVLCDLKKKKI